MEKGKVSSFLGGNGKFKSSHRNKEPETFIAERTRGVAVRAVFIPSESVDRNSVEFSLWDYAGQEEVCLLVLIVRFK